MTITDHAVPDRFVEILDRLGRMSVEDYYNPYRMFEWADQLPENAYWMTPELITAHGTPVEDEIGVEGMKRLSRWESINFYSLNVHGIRELLIEVIRRIHTPGFEVPSEFFHHFIGEENEHMWFFAEFCRRYGAGKIYSTPSIKTQDAGSAETENFLVFARILLFEEIVDHYNARMADDGDLHETIRQVNRIHHHDESRHIAFGRELVSLLYQRVREQAGEEQLRELEAYLKRYIVFSLQSFYNPQVYRDAGFSDPLQVRSRILADPYRRTAERKAVRKPVSFFVKTGIFSDSELYAA
ncbi:diiron oxygenase [Streptomyces sp. H39-C1]|uniref:diiron oxygenase n=1 Tax=Streptomyces sp. H39-C1 TaxID=3004355 RepID=UPI0022AFC1DB|nr:diiron oxygenase [Streptomyces sp. H39-C1]MCZ4102292.1 diiron oxygenase [Streptomyces sp. H39-C1]